MFKQRHVFTALALAVFQVANAQAPLAGPAGAPAEPAGAATAAPQPAMPSAEQPRIIRGNDRVIQPPAPVRIEGPGTSFKFEDAPIGDVAHVILRDVMKVDYVLHPPLNGTVTLATRTDVSADQAASLLESALQANGLVMARDARGVYHVGKPESLRGIVPASRQAGNGPLPPGTGAIVVPLQYIGAAEMATILRPMLPPDALLRVDNMRNLLVLAGSRSQAEGWLSLVSTFDVDLLQGMSVGVFPLKHATVREVEAALRLMSAGPATPRTTGAAAGGAQPAAGTDAAAAAESYPLYGAVRVLPIERLNSVLVVTPRAAYLEEARRWIERLDQPGSGNNEARLHVYAVQNGSAKHLADVLNGIFGSQDNRSSSSQTSGVAPGLAQTTATTPTIGTLSAGGANAGVNLSGQAARTSGPASSGPTVTAVTLGGVRVVADEINNAVLVYGPGAEYLKIEQTLRRLDVPRTQVLIEASIIEVTLGDDLRYGLQWAFTENRGGGATGTSVLSAAAGAVLPSPAAGFSYTLRNSIGSVRAVLQALAEKSLVNVISSPSLMVLDNHTASIAVGDQQPVQGAQTFLPGGNVSTSIQYKDTGVTLAVTPSVNAGNVVTMQINQAVTDVGEIDTATGQRSFLQRQIGSKVAVRSGETLVLGGLIRNNRTSGSSGVPLLHEIPLLGALFGTKRSEDTRTELLVVITPRVVRSDQDLRDVGNDLRERMKAFSVIDIPGLGVPKAGAGVPRSPEEPAQPGSVKGTPNKGSVQQ